MKFKKGFSIILCFFVCFIIFTHSLAESTIDEICTKFETDLGSFATPEKGDEYRAYYDNSDDTFYVYMKSSGALFGLAGRAYENDSEIWDAYVEMLKMNVLPWQLFTEKYDKYKESKMVIAFVNGMFDNFHDYVIPKDWSEYSTLSKDQYAVIYSITVKSVSDHQQAHFEIYDPFGDTANINKTAEDSKEYLSFDIELLYRLYNEQRYSFYSNVFSNKSHLEQALNESELIPGTHKNFKTFYHSRDYDIAMYILNDAKDNNIYFTFTAGGKESPLQGTPMGVLAQAICKLDDTCKAEEIQSWYNNFIDGSEFTHNNISISLLLDGYRAYIVIPQK